jgi:hypothetical protein
MNHGKGRFRGAQKIDRNQKEIVDGLRKAGAFVQTFGAVDLVVGYRGLWHLIEVKDGSLPPSGQRLTKDEIFFVLEVKNRAPVHVVRDIAEAFAAVGIVS